MRVTRKEDRMNAYVREHKGRLVVKVEGDARKVWKTAYGCVRSCGCVTAGEYTFRPYQTSGLYMGKAFQYKRVTYSTEKGLQYYG